MQPADNPAPRAVPEGSHVPCAAGAALIAIFTLLTIAVVTDLTHGLDVAVARHLHTFGSTRSWLVSGARWVTFLGSPIVLVGVTAAVVVILIAHPLTGRRDWRRTGVFIATAAGGAALNTLLKYAVHRARPPDATTFVIATDPSYPSGHAANSTIIYGATLLLILPMLTRAGRWTATSATAILVLGIAASRLVLGVHWLTDVVAGLLLGVSWITLAFCARRATSK